MLNIQATIDVKEAAKYIGVSVDTIYSMVKGNEIPHIRVRRRIFFRTNALDQWMVNQEKGGVSL